MIIHDIINVLNASKKIAITFHVSPDGDSLGSSLALMLGLKSNHKDVYIVTKDNLPETYSFLPSYNEIIISEGTILDDTDCVVVIDCGNLERVSANLNLKLKAYNLINIDHHITNEFYGDLNLVNTNSAATGEIIYELLNSMGVNIDKNISVCLYTSIIADTGGFKHSNTTADTHKIAGKLINNDINFSDIHRIVFENKKFKRLKLIAKAIDGMYLINNICVIKLTKNMLDEIGIEASDTSDIISIGGSIDTIEVTVLFRETDEGIKVSLRSKSIVDVRKIAESFGGGGHIRASGLLINKSLAEAEHIIIKAIEKELIK
ncbi:bifunctional oligoribonuclease/PAP phosphatase NrnA [Clostridium sp. SYSU_GA19001]|uniref:DHH family phosphoesterase n=1 Tax=Clostridium caldaquaticum TaxID=2940653 RepID=UPI0020775F88|nr:bifunctional oligoribonuclease/PAP phosphatase NrnA [Clostridium caldaquaticum]MCM8710629.1 bifunctional oligoribonuclease/PAP phosphatase NrnA [Clostridium caldaquaticum]